MIVCNLLLLLLFSIQYSPTVIEALNDVPQCFFAEPRINSLESCPRPSFARVTGICSDGELTKLSDLQKISVDTHGAVNELEVVLGRGAGIFYDGTAVFARKFSDKFICRKHLDELVRKWSQAPYGHTKLLHSSRGRKTICGVPGYDRPIVLARPRYLTKTMAHNYLLKFHQLLPIGLPICDAHSDLSVPVDLEALESEMKDPTWKEEPKDSPAVASDVLSAFNLLVDKAKIRGACPAADFRSFARDTKQRRVYALRKLTDIMLSIMAPGAETDLKEMFAASFYPRTWRDSSETKLRKVLDEISDQYEKSTDRRTKEIILSVVADILPYREIQNVIPGVSIRRYYNAKRRAIRKEELQVPKFHKTRYEPVRINLFITFITSPFVSIGLPYGERTVKLSDGKKDKIPNTLRLYRNSEIWRMYSKYMEDSVKNHLKVTESVAHEMLRRCGATRRHALVCVDYFVSAGLDSFEDLDDILDTLLKNVLMDPDMHKTMKQSLLRSKQYLRTDYKVHAKKESRVSDHCMLHGLSDPVNKAFKYTGTPHDHSIRCNRCKQLDSTLQDMVAMIDGLDNNMPSSHGMKRELSEMRLRMEQNIEKITEMKKHFLRSAYNNQERDWIINSLDEGEALVTLDFAQKALPMYKWEDQKKYYGKRGMSYHVTHVLAKKHGHFVQHSFVHVVYTTKQDNVAVVQMLRHALFKMADMGLKAAHLRSDNAGAYHSLGTLASISSLASDSDINVKSFSFSEPQNGKSSCDRVAAQVKRRVRDYIAARNTVADEAGFFKAINQSGLDGVSVYLARITRGTEKEEKEAVKKLSPQMDNIMSLGYFKFHKESVRAWRYYGIGQGVKYDNLKGFTNEIEILEEGGKFASDASKKVDEDLLLNNENPKLFWLAYLKKDPTAVNDEPDDNSTMTAEGKEKTDANGEGLFVCSECGASYIKYSNLLRHLETGRHFVRPEKLTLYDFALKLYKEGLEDVIKKNNILDEVNEAIAVMGTDDGSDALEEGWALPSKRKSGHYSEKAKAFVEKKFNEGAKTGRKMDSAEAERLMKEDTSIKPHERMNAQQIRSYFSKLCNLQKTASASTSRASRLKRRIDDQFECEEDLSDEEVEFIDDFGRQTDDVLEDMIHESRNELFIDPENAYLEIDS